MAGNGLAEGGSRRGDQRARRLGCPELLAKIRELVDREKRGNDGTKGLRQRFRDFRNDDQGHREAIVQQQRSLRSYLMEYERKGCSDGVPPDAAELAGRALPPPSSAPRDPERFAGLLRGLASAFRVRFPVYRRMGAPLTHPSGFRFEV